MSRTDTKNGCGTVNVEPGRNLESRRARALPREGWTAATQVNMAEEAIRAMQEQFSVALEGLTRQSADLQAELTQRRQQAPNQIAALIQEVRTARGGSPPRGPETSGTGNQEAW